MIRTMSGVRWRRDGETWVTLDGRFAIEVDAENMTECEAPGDEDGRCIVHGDLIGACLRPYATRHVWDNETDSYAVEREEVDTPAGKLAAIAAAFATEHPEYVG